MFGCTGSALIDHGDDKMVTILTINCSKPFQDNNLSRRKYDLIVSGARGAWLACLEAQSLQRGVLTETDDTGPDITGTLPSK